jgi:hypothetical protein
MPQFKLANLQRAVIHVPESAAAPIAFAAEELQRYLRKRQAPKPIGRFPVSGFLFPVLHCS